MKCQSNLRASAAMMTAHDGPLHVAGTNVLIRFVHGLRCHTEQFAHGGDVEEICCAAARTAMTLP